MKKFAKVIGVIALLITIFASLGSSIVETAEASKNHGDKVTVTLNKKKMTTLPDPLIQNTGEVMTEFSGYDNMPNVTFEVRDVTTEFYNLRAGGTSFEAAMSAVATNPVGGTVVSTNTTGSHGLASFNLPEKSGGKDAVYVFVETNAPSGTTKADNMTLVLPMYDANNNVMKEILLYPKNVVDANGSVTVTKIGTAKSEKLQNAKFIVSRELTEGKVEYLAAFNMVKGLYNWVSNEEDALLFSTDINGQFTIRNLEHGDYQLIEMVAPNNAAIIGDGVTPFTINESEKSVTLTIKNDTIELDKKLEEKEDNFNVGELISYSITVNVPVGITDTLADGTFKHGSFIIKDVPDVGLQFNNDLTSEQLALDASWIDTDGTNGFVLTIPAAALANLAGKTLTLNYHMYLDENAVPDVGYDNVATVTTNKLTDSDYTDDVFTGGKKFIKKDKNFSKNNGLEGAKFVIRNADADDAKYLKIDDETKVVSWVDTVGEATEFESNNNGLFEVAGLEYGTYYLEETEAPEDYVLLDKRIGFKIYHGSYKTHKKLDIYNIRKGRLPSTGGSGIAGFIGLGAVLVASTGGYYIQRKRKD